MNTRRTEQEKEAQPRDMATQPREMAAQPGEMATQPAQSNQSDLADSGVATAPKSKKTEKQKVKDCQASKTYRNKKKDAVLALTVERDALIELVDSQTVVEMGLQAEVDGLQSGLLELWEILDDYRLSFLVSHVVMALTKKAEEEKKKKEKEKEL